ncbi:MAG: CcdB family protein [Acetobacteraceae bacterium]|nr:CcdB family protein [Acetobacteraceae bacterium]
MARLDVHSMPSKAAAGFVLDVQADLLSHLATRAVVPLLPEEVAPKPIGELNPVFEIRGQRLVMLTQAIAAIPGRELKGIVASLANEHDRVTRALDILLVGF